MYPFNPADSFDRLNFSGNNTNWKRNDASNQWNEPSNFSQSINVPPNEWVLPPLNEGDPGMNGDGVGGWQGHQPGGRGSHHLNGGGGGGRRGMHNQQQNRLPNQHHGGHHRMMAPNYRQQPQQQPYVYVQEIMDMNVMRLGDMSLNGGPPSQVMAAQQNGMYVEMPPQAAWSQPQPFGPQDDLYDHVTPFGVGPPSAQHNGGGGGGGGGNGSQYGSGGVLGGRGYNRMGQGGSRQGGNGYRQQQQQPQSFGMPMPMQPHQMNGPQQQGGQPFYAPQQPFVAPMVPGGHPLQQQQQQNPMDIGNFAVGGASGRGGSSDGGGGGGGSGFPISTSTMDDYSMWTDENDEETKKKKILRDKGLLVWGDAETSNSKPIRRWIVGEGQEEDIDTAMARCPHYQKKKSVHEEALKRRLTSENQQIVAQAQQQLEEERTAMLRVGRRPVVACGWGDLPAELAEKNANGGGNNGSTSSEPRNPFFAQHMQQQQMQGAGISGNQGGFIDPVVGDGVWSTGNQFVPSSVVPGVGVPSQIMSGPAGGVHGIGSMGGVGVVGGGEVMDENRQKVAENLRYAVEKGHLDIGLLSLTHIPPNILDLLTIILSKIPMLDNNQAELKNLVDNNRPAEISPDVDPNTWLDEDLKIEYEKLVINVVTAKIEVTDLSKKINRALAEAGLTKRGGVGRGVDGPGTSRDGGQNRPDAFTNGPPDQCDYYDYSFLG